MITVISQQGKGTITVYGNLVNASDIVTDQTVYGAYERVDSLAAGVHFQLEDDGVLAGGGNDGGLTRESRKFSALARPQGWRRNGGLIWQTHCV